MNNVNISNNEEIEGTIIYRPKENKTSVLSYQSPHGYKIKIQELEILCSSLRENNELLMNENIRLINTIKELRVKMNQS
jgi:hypothetical protein